MTLQTSGAISLNQIHIEAGGSSGTQVSMNDLDVRYLTNAASGASSSFNNFYGRSRHRVTAGSGSYNSVNYTGYKTSTPTMGSVDDSNLTWTSASWTGLYYATSGTDAYQKHLLLGGSGSGSNSGFTTMRIAGTTFARTSASFNGSSNIFSLWKWYNPSNLLTNGTSRDTYFY